MGCCVMGNWEDGVGGARLKHTTGADGGTPDVEYRWKSELWCWSRKRSRMGLG